MSTLRRLAGLLLDRTGLGLLPVHVRSGIAKGARWTLSPRPSYWRGTHEVAIQQLMLGLNGGNIRGWSCWDLGAHFGLYSVGLARHVGADGQVAAFEPDPISFRRLERHRRLNRLDWLKTFNAAVSDHNGGAEIFTYGETGSTTTHLPYENEPRTENVGALQVRTVRLDDLVREGQIRPPQFIKVDVEGHGRHAVNGMRETLSSHHPMVLMGFHTEFEIQGTLEILRPLGYLCHAVTDHVEVSEPAVGCDYFFTAGHRSKSGA